MRTYVISGATGMIGRTLAAYLLARGDRVLALVRPDSNRTAGLPLHENFRLIGCDMADYATYTPDESADAFFHLAWAKTAGAGRDDAAAQWQNVRYALDAAELAARFGCKKFVGAGSQAEYGPADAPLTADTPVHPESGYGIAKYAAGKLTALLCRQRGLAHCWVRILSIYGEGDGENTLISYLIRALQNGETPELTPCEQIWDYLYADDAAAALAAIADRGRDGAVYPLGSGQGRPLSDYVKTLRDCVAPDARVAFGARPYYPHQPMYLAADISTLTADTGFSPRVSFAEGIRRILAAQKEE